MSKKLHFTLFLKYYDLNFWVLRVFKKKKCSLLVFFFLIAKIWTIYNYDIKETPILKDFFSVFIDRIFTLVVNGKGSSDIRPNTSVFKRGFSN